MIVFLTRAAPVDALVAVWTTAVSQAPPGMTQVAAGLLGLSLVHSVLRRPPEGARQIVVAVVAALIGTLAFHSAFGLIKTSMPYIIPFWADPLFAGLDQALHFGVDPWRLTHDLGALLPMEAILPAYLSIWPSRRFVCRSSWPRLTRTCGGCAGSWRSMSCPGR